MELWVYPGSAASPNRDQLAAWLRTIYAEVYHCRHDDPRIEEMMARIPL
jgi:hypothetical protein